MTNRDMENFLHFAAVSHTECLEAALVPRAARRTSPLSKRVLSTAQFKKISELKLERRLIT